MIYVHLRSFTAVFALAAAGLLLALCDPARTDPPATDTRAWAFRPPIRPARPKVKQTAWVRNPIDAFILAKLEAAGLHPAAPADKITLLRRATFDLTGLPPTPAEVDAFLADRAPNAYEKVIDRLLASPHYGERWARHWLDLARYAESEGFKSDEPRPNAWRYRDYVIGSLNADKPYDRFVKEQIAGDELYPDDPDALVATGFCRHWADESNARNLRLRRQEILNDITDTTGATLLGLTIGCARCHDHKYDPIPQKDYYRLQAFFAAVQPREDLVLPGSAERARWEQQQKEWEEKTKDVRAQLAALEEPVRRHVSKGKYDKFPPDVKEAIDTPAAKRTSLQWLLFHKVEPQLDVSAGEIAGAMKPDQKRAWTELNGKLDVFKLLKPAPMPLALGITDVGPDAPKTYTLAVGVYDRPVEEVRPGFPAALDPAPPTITSPRPDTTGRRSALANWLAGPQNPLTARVLLNRVWQYHFGRGLVATPSDFGRAGERPTHPALLDWLATEFVREGWSFKRLHRLILTSATYRQAASYDAAAARIDPDDRLLWRFRRQRMEGEVLRDAILAVSGELNPKMGGPSVMPELPGGVTARGSWRETSDPTERRRRSIYVFVKRNLRYPLFEAFDMPDTHEPCARRQVTTTAPQALMMLNDELILRSARAFAGRLLREAGGDPRAQIERAYRLAYSRRPNPEEGQAAQEFLAKQARLIAARAAKPENLATPLPLPARSDPAAGAALVDFCHALINSNEFLYVE